MIEILNPRWGDVRPVFEREFQGMVVEPVTAEELRFVGEKLVSRLHEEMTQDEKQFIVSVKEGKPPMGFTGGAGNRESPCCQVPSFDAAGPQDDSPSFAVILPRPP